MANVLLSEAEKIFILHGVQVCKSPVSRVSNQEEDSPSTLTNISYIWLKKLTIFQLFWGTLSDNVVLVNSFCICLYTVVCTWYTPVHWHLIMLMYTYSITHDSVFPLGVG